MTLFALEPGQLIESHDIHVLSIVACICCKDRFFSPILPPLRAPGGGTTPMEISTGASADTRFHIDEWQGKMDWLVVERLQLEPRSLADGVHPCCIRRGLEHGDRCLLSGGLLPWPYQSENGVIWCSHSPK